MAKDKNKFKMVGRTRPYNVDYLRCDLEGELEDVPLHWYILALHVNRKKVEGEVRELKRVVEALSERLKALEYKSGD